MKQTAVEWLESKMLEDYSPFYNKRLYEAIHKAKEMEKEQIIKAHGDKLRKSKGDTNYEYWYNGEDYFNDNFKSE